MGETRLQGREAVKTYLKENPEVADELEEKIRENAHKLMAPQAKPAPVSSNKTAGQAVDISADDFEG